MPRRKKENNDVQFMSKQIQRRMKKSVTPAVIRYEVQIIITPETTKHRTSIVFISHRQTLSSPQNRRNSHKYHCFRAIIRMAQMNRMYVPRLLAYLLTLSWRTSLTTSRKLVIKVTETRLLNTSRKQLFHKPRFMLNVDYPWTPLPFNFKFKF